MSHHKHFNNNRGGYRQFSEPEPVVEVVGIVVDKKPSLLEKAKDRVNSLPTAVKIAGIGAAAIGGAWVIDKTLFSGKGTKALLGLFKKKKTREDDEEEDLEVEVEVDEVEEDKE